MEFIDRKEELKELERAHSLSRKKLFPIVLFGARRIGKTRLMEEFSKDKKFLYFFVYDGKGARSLLREFEKELKEKKIIDEYRKINSMEEFIEIIFMKCGGYVVVFDEIQYMLSSYKPFFSLMQRKIDENIDYPAMFVFLGSVVGLVKKVFEDLKSPLYGRMKQQIILKPLKYEGVRKALSLLAYTDEKDFATFYAVFGGFPKYYAAMEDYQLRNIDLRKAIEFLFFRENAPLKNEVISILRQEFGKGKSYYYDILEAIATGHTKLNEIATYVGKHQTEITPFMKDLIDYYEIIKREAIITEDPKKTRFSVYLFNSPLFKFWFRFVYPNLKYMELSQFDWVLKNVSDNLNSYIGIGFEEVCKEAISKIRPNFSLIGKWWGHQREEGVRKPVEIDIAAINEQKKEILFAECKWQDKVDSDKVLAELKKKSELVKWNNGKRKEYFAIFAKSFKRKTDAADVLLFDLNDFKKIFKE